MKSLIACQNEASRGLSSASRLTALSSSSSAARRAARFVPTGVRKSRILSSAVGSLFASNSDDRAREPQGFHACIEASTHDHAQRAYSVGGALYGLRCYGASGEEIAPSSPQQSDGAPPC